MLKKVIAALISVIFVFEQTGLAQVAPQMPVPAYLSTLMTPDHFRPVHMRSLAFDPATQALKVFIDHGDASISKADLQKNSSKLLEYFQIGLRLPNNTFWVNLRPDTADQIIDPVLENTDLGRVLLAADLQLKKDLAMLTSPDSAEGSMYWKRMYERAEQLFGSESVEIPALTRPWIVPGEVVVRQTAESVYIYKATLKVMLEEDYLRTAAAPSLVSQSQASQDARFKSLNEYASQLVRELIIPKLTRQVNASRKYAELRQAYYSLVLAQWYKTRFKDAAIDSGDIASFVSKQPWSKDTYYQQYKQSFEKGEYKKEEAIRIKDSLIIRQYVSGGAQISGMQFKAIIAENNDRNAITKGMAEFKLNENEMTLISDADLAVEAGTRDGGAGEVTVKEQELPEGRLRRWEFRHGLIEKDKLGRWDLTQKGLVVTIAVPATVIVGGLALAALMAGASTDQILGFLAGVFSIFSLIFGPIIISEVANSGSNRDGGKEAELKSLKEDVFSMVPTPTLGHQYDDDYFSLGSRTTLERKYAGMSYAERVELLIATLEALEKYFDKEAPIYKEIAPLTRKAQALLTAEVKDDLTKVDAQKQKDEAVRVSAINFIAEALKPDNGILVYPDRSAGMPRLRVLVGSTYDWQDSYGGGHRSPMGAAPLKVSKMVGFSIDSIGYDVFINEAADPIAVMDALVKERFWQHNNWQAETDMTFESRSNQALNNGRVLRMLRQHLETVLNGGTVSQASLADLVTTIHPQVTAYVKDVPVMMYKVEQVNAEGYFSELPKGMAEVMGVLDDTDYRDAWKSGKYNDGYVVAMQYAKGKPDFYPMTMASFKESYKEVEIAQAQEKNADEFKDLRTVDIFNRAYESKDSKLIAGLKMKPTNMVKMSELCFAKDKRAEIADPWDSTQVKEAGDEAYIVLDAKDDGRVQYYMVQEVNGLPKNYILLDASSRDGGLEEISEKIMQLVNDSEYGFDKGMVDAFLADPTNPDTMRPMIAKIQAYYGRMSTSPSELIYTQGMYEWADIMDDLNVIVHRQNHPAKERAEDQKKTPENPNKELAKKELNDLIGEEREKIENKVFQGPFGRSMFDGLTSEESAHAEANARNRYADRHHGPRYEVVNGRLRVEDITRDGGVTQDNINQLAAKIRETMEKFYGAYKPMIVRSAIRNNPAVAARAFAEAVPSYGRLDEKTDEYATFSKEGFQLAGEFFAMLEDADADWNEKAALCRQTWDYFFPDSFEETIAQQQNFDVENDPYIIGGQEWELNKGSIELEGIIKSENEMWEKSNLGRAGDNYYGKSATRKDNTEASSRDGGLVTKIEEDSELAKEFQSSSWNRYQLIQKVASLESRHTTNDYMYVIKDVQKDEYLMILTFSVNIGSKEIPLHQMSLGHDRAIADAAIAYVSKNQPFARDLFENNRVTVGFYGPSGPEKLLGIFQNQSRDGGKIAEATSYSNLLSRIYQGVKSDELNKNAEDIARSFVRLTKGYIDSTEPENGTSLGSVEENMGNLLTLLIKMSNGEELNLSSIHSIRDDLKWNSRNFSRLLSWKTAGLFETQAYTYHPYVVRPDETETIHYIRSLDEDAMIASVEAAVSNAIAGAGEVTAELQEKKRKKEAQERSALETRLENGKTRLEMIKSDGVRVEISNQEIPEPLKQALLADREIVIVMHDGSEFLVKLMYQSNDSGVEYLSSTLRGKTIRAWVNNLAADKYGFARSFEFVWDTAAQRKHAELPNASLQEEQGLRYYAGLKRNNLGVAVNNYFAEDVAYLIVPNLGKSNDPQNSRDGGKENVLGGIDLRVMPLPLAGASAVPAMDMKALQALAANAGIADVDKAWKKVAEDIANKTVPYDQLKGLIAVCCQNGSKQQIDEISLAMAQLLKMEEECAVQTSVQMQEVLQMLEMAV